ncbi:MAG: hypothetical protein ACI4D4_04150 [Lachnospira sp.]
MHNSNNETSNNCSNSKKTKMMPWVRAAIFMTILVMVFSFLKYALIPPSYARIIIHEMNDETTSYDTIFLGASHGRSGLDPYAYDEEADTNSLNVCIPNETMRDSYYLCKESTRYNDVETIILDVDYQYWTLDDKKVNAYSAAFIYDQLEFSSVKLEYFSDIYLEEDFRVTLSRWSDYLGSVSKIPDNIKKKSSSAYKNYETECIDNKDGGGPYIGKGFYNRKALGPKDGMGVYKKVKFDKNKVASSNVSYFKKILKYCEEKDIRLVCIVSPITPVLVYDEEGEYEKVHEYFTKFFEDLGVEFYDFNYVKEDVLSVEKRHFVDYDGHMTGELADSYTRVLAKVLKDGEDGEVDMSKYFKDEITKMPSGL